MNRKSVKRLTIRAHVAPERLLNNLRCVPCFGKIIFSEYSPSFPLSLDFCFRRPFFNMHKDVVLVSSSGFLTDERTEGREEVGKEISVRLEWARPNNVSIFFHSSSERFLLLFTHPRTNVQTTLIISCSIENHHKKINSFFHTLLVLVLSSRYDDHYFSSCLRFSIQFLGVFSGRIDLRWFEVLVLLSFRLIFVIIGSFKRLKCRKKWERPDMTLRCLSLCSTWSRIDFPFNYLSRNWTSLIPRIPTALCLNDWFISDSITRCTWHANRPFI